MKQLAVVSLRPKHCLLSVLMTGLVFFALRRYLAPWPEPTVILTHEASKQIQRPPWGARSVLRRAGSLRASAHASQGRPCLKACGSAVPLYLFALALVLGLSRIRPDLSNLTVTVPDLLIVAMKGGSWF